MCRASISLRWRLRVLLGVLPSPSDLLFFWGLWSVGPSSVRFLVDTIGMDYFCSLYQRCIPGKDHVWEGRFTSPNSVSFCDDSDGPDLALGACIWSLMHLCIRDDH